MARLIYGTLMSLDGYIADEAGNFDWAAPDEEVHAFVNDLERPVGTYLYGRRTYEVMTFWETALDEPDLAGPMRDYAHIWGAADKVVYSRTLEVATTARTRLERDFEPAAVRALVAEADRDIGIAGPTLAAHAFAAGLVDECWCVVAPALVGGGLRGLPDGVRLDLELTEQRRFGGGAVFLRYAVRR